jgi:endophilin-B
MNKFTSGAETLFNRAKQFTAEKLGGAEKTEYDESFKGMLDRADKTKTWTEKIVKQTECFLQPNPAVRVEDFVQAKLTGYKATKLMETDLLGQIMIDAGNDLSSGAPSYGSALVKCGEAQQKIGAANREFIETSVKNFIQPLQQFLDEDIKNLQKERSTLETKRLDLDALKSKLKRAKPGATEPPTSPSDDKVEAELKVGQEEYDKQVDVTRKLLESVETSHIQHQRCLQDFIEAQANFYAVCHQQMSDLQKQLSAR